MEDIFNKEEHAKNLYVIRHKLNNLKRVVWAGHFEWYFGPFIVKIFADKHGDPAAFQYVTQYEKVDVHVYEVSRKDEKENQQTLINLLDDSRFNNYKPIQYNIIETPNGTINMIDGHQMPINYLCELIRYLHRLSNLTAFM
jgi:hypothetical protein